MASEQAIPDNSRPQAYSLLGVDAATGLETRRLGVDDLRNMMISLGTALAQNYDSILTYPRGVNAATALTASGLVQTGAGKLAGVFVNSVTSTPTLKIWDNTAGSGTVLIDTFTLVAGQTFDFKHARFAIGCYFTITGTATVTPLIDPTTT